MDKIDKLKKLYNLNSKHSNYQILPKQLYEILGEDEIKVRSRYENERLKYILENVDVKDKTLLDIGGNTGFFSLELLSRGAFSVHLYEGNKVHTDFVSLAANVFNIEDKIKITNNYFLFEANSENRKYDIILLLNVLHHVGDDYGKDVISIEFAKQKIITQVNSLANITSILIFQLGFNWKGNRNLGLFKNGTKQEMIDFIATGVKDHWAIDKIGIADEIGNKIEYSDLNDSNRLRNDSLGEFLNRPIFILKSLY